MFRINLEGLSGRRKNIWSSAGDRYISINDSANGYFFRVHESTLTNFLGKSYDMYLNFENVTVYYTYDGINDSIIIENIDHENLHWNYYGDNSISIPNCGKWMCFFKRENLSYIELIAHRIISEKIADVCKHTNLNKNKSLNTGVLCIYIDGFSIESHLRVLEFMKSNSLIRKTKSNNFFNISFKFDYQTQQGQYNKDYKPVIQLSSFIDLKTGQTKKDINL